VIACANKHTYIHTYNCIGRD